VSTCLRAICIGIYRESVTGDRIYINVLLFFLFFFIFIFLFFLKIIVIIELFQPQGAGAWLDDEACAVMHMVSVVGFSQHARSRVWASLIGWLSFMW